MTAEYDALTIAKWFVAWAEADEADVSNLKVQKLLYYAQGHHLAMFGSPLFRDKIQAWSHGPVVENVYHELKQFGRTGVVLPDDDPFVFDEVDEETTRYLMQVWNTYGAIAAWRLRDMTHETGPWQRHFVPDQRYIAIPQDEIQKYFLSLPAA